MSQQRHWLDKLPTCFIRLGINLWGPNMGSGIKIKKIDENFRYIEVIMKMHWYNKNYVGTHFGGSLFSMTDPYYMFILLKNLGPDYIIWDKAATIEYKKPGRGTLTATFQFSEDDIQAIRTQADQQGKYIFDKSVDIFDQEGDVIASVVKTLYVRRRKNK